MREAKGEYIAFADGDDYSSDNRIELEVACLEKYRDVLAVSCWSNYIDGEGRILFKELIVKGVYEEDKLLGFIQYGKSSFVFNEEGNISENSYYQIPQELFVNNLYRK